MADDKYIWELDETTDLESTDVFLVGINQTTTPETEYITYSGILSSLEDDLDISSGTPKDFISGLRLIWNSGTSISISTGSCGTEAGTTYSVTTAITKSSLSLSNSTWYHVYLISSTDAEITTTAPATAYLGTARSKTGDNTKRYLGSIKTDGSGNVKNFIHNPFTNYIGYTLHDSDDATHRVLATGTATTATAVGLSGVIPTTALFAYVRVINNSDKILYTSESNGVGGTQNTVGLAAGNTAAQNAFMIHPVDSSLQIWYVLSAAVGVGGAFIDVDGYFYTR